MPIRTIWRRAAAAAAALALPSLLSGCFLSPGNFVSTLDLRKDGAFAFTYRGDIHMMALSSLADMADEADAAADFEQQPCYDDNFEERACSAEEIEQQKSDWADMRKAKQEDDKQKSEAFKAMMGGIDPADPEAAKEIADRLARQKGWNKVEYRGDGLFVVDFSIASRIDHDFTFPVFEGFPMANPFVVVTPRNGNAVRIEAPAFSAQSASANPMAGFLQAASSEKDGDKPKAVPELNGKFTITTNGAILANNTDEGPQAVTTGQQLSWTVTKRTTAAPTALIRLGN